MATIVRADGRTEPLHASSRAGLSLTQLQEAVGGFIEIVAFGNGLVVCNEDGLLRQLPVNVRYPRFVGDIVLCRRDEVQ